MKKVTLFLSAIVCVAVMASCGGNSQKKTAEGQTCDKAQKEQCSMEEKGHKGHHACNMTEEQKAECKAFQEKWDNFDNLTVEEQKELIAQRKDRMEKRRAEMEEKTAECDAKWANFDNLSVAEQKEFLDQAGCCKKDKGCEKKCEKKVE